MCGLHADKQAAIVSTTNLVIVTSVVVLTARTRLVSTLMDVSRLEAGRLKGSFRMVNLGLVTRDLAVSAEMSACSGRAEH